MSFWYPSSSVMSSEATTCLPAVWDCLLERVTSRWPETTSPLSGSVMMSFPLAEKVDVGSWDSSGSSWSDNCLRFCYKVQLLIILLNHSHILFGFFFLCNPFKQSGRLNRATYPKQTQEHNPDTHTKIAASFKHRKNNFKKMKRAQIWHN